MESTVREQFGLEFVEDCWACRKAWRGNTIWRSLQTHEIARGVNRWRGLTDRAAMLRLCERCHQQMDDGAVWPVARQLALKKVCDPKWYDRVTVNVMRGRTPDAITEEEVDAYVQELQEVWLDGPVRSYPR